MDRARLGDWNQTYTGVQFWPLDPHADEVRIEDIAHSLAHQCRFGGHCLTFYSVAEHSVRVSRIVPLEHALWGLLHDASEAYAIDVPRPLKRHLEGYKAIEEKLERVIANKFSLPWPMPESVKHADEVLLMTEKRDIMSPAPAPWGVAQGVPAEPLEEKIVPWTAEVAEMAFLARYYELVGAKDHSPLPEPAATLRVDKQWLLAFMNVLRTGMRYELQGAPVPPELRKQLEAWCEETRVHVFGH